MIALELVVSVMNGSCFFVNLSICSKKTGGKRVRLDQVEPEDSTGWIRRLAARARNLLLLLSTRF